MTGLVAQQLLAIAGCALVVGLPGWAVIRLLELQLRLPIVALPAAGFVLGLSTWTLAVVPCLTFGWSIHVTLAIQAALTAVLLVAALRRQHVRGHAKAGTNAVSAWTVGAIAACALLAAALRTRIAFDTLFHVGLVRRLLELDAPTFANVDRVVGSGVNPAYALPAWQSAMAGIAAVTGLDPATVVEAMAVVAVLVAACAAAGLGRAITGTVQGEIAGAAAYAWLRVFFPRRELEGDGVAYAALPGNLAVDVLLPLVLIVALVLVQRGRRDRGSLALALVGAATMVLLVVLHANYVVYVAIIGVGAVGWLVAAGPWTRAARRRLRRVVLVLGVPGAVALAAALPVLALLEHFGAPLETRIDYHLVGSGAWQVIRPGHLYDWFAAPGLLAVLALPWAAWRSRGMARALVAGGALAFLAFALVPPLLDLLTASGSRTLALRMPRPFGVLLVAAVAVALPDLVALVLRGAGDVARRRGRWAGVLVRVLPLAAVAVLAALYGYPRARLDPPEYGWNWPTLAALAGLLVVLVLGIRTRRTTEPLEVFAPASSPGAVLATSSLGLSILAVGVCLLPSGVTSLRRGAWQSRQLVASYRADDLGCYAGIQAQLRKVPGGALVLADPVTGYGVQALAPGRIVADFKTWNGTTDTKRIDRRIQLLRALYGSSSPERAGAALARLSIDEDASWLVVSRGEVFPPLGSELDPFDARGLRELLASGDIGARRVAAGQGSLRGGAADSDRAACELELWRLDGSERDLEQRRDGDHA